MKVLEKCDVHIPLLGILCVPAQMSPGITQRTSITQRASQHLYHPANKQDDKDAPHKRTLPQAGQLTISWPGPAVPGPVVAPKAIVNPDMVNLN